MKEHRAEQLADAVRRVHRGERVVDPALAAATLAGGASPLTGRERDVLVAARDGATVADIARQLFLSEGTVRNYLSAAIAKTGARNRLEAMRVADSRGWLCDQTCGIDLGRDELEVVEVAGGRAPAGTAGWRRGRRSSLMRSTHLGRCARRARSRAARPARVRSRRPAA